MLSSIVLANSTSRGPPTRWEAFSIIALTRSRMRLVIGLAMMDPKYLLMAPTLGAIDMPLSLSTMIRSRPEWPALFIASYGSPQVRAPSPTTATTLKSSPFRSRAVAIPRAADRPVPAWPAPKWSCGLSVRRRKPLRPPGCRSVGNWALRPVRIFHGYP